MHRRPACDEAIDPIEIHRWIREMEMHFCACHGKDDQKVKFAVTKLEYSRHQNGGVNSKKPQVPTSQIVLT